MEPYLPTGRQLQAGSAALVTGAPGTTQQLGCDNSEITNFRAVTGAQLTSGSVQPL